MYLLHLLCTLNYSYTLTYSMPTFVFSCSAWVIQADILMACDQFLSQTEHYASNNLTSEGQNVLHMPLFSTRDHLQCDLQSLWDK